MQIILFC